jgi:hypothetical protein
MKCTWAVVATLAALAAACASERNEESAWLADASADGDKGDDDAHRADGTLGADDAHGAATDGAMAVIDSGACADAGLQADATPSGGGSDGSAAGTCGYRNAGVVLHVAAGLDVCLPPAVCASETCPPGAGRCVNGKCVFEPGYQGIATLPQAWATYYCDLASQGCNGVGQNDAPAATAQKIASAMNLPLCTQASGGSTCVGIAAAPPMMVGNSQVAIDPQTGSQVKDWGLGLTEASGLCYELTGPGGKAVVALTDRCGGFCQCNGSDYQECGACVNAADMHPDCPCVGSVPPLYANCCGRTCVTAPSPCDWCASNNHPHFDLDMATYSALCGSQAMLGSCQLQTVAFLPCFTPTTWPPP